MRDPNTQPIKILKRRPSFIVGIRKLVLQQTSVNHSDASIDSLAEVANQTPVTVVTTYRLRTRPQKDWNKLGREIYSSKRSMQHAKKITDVLKSLGISELYFELKHSRRPWLPAFTKKYDPDLYQEIQSFFGLPKSILSTLPFGFRLSSCERITEFFNLFLGYPLRFHYQNILCIALNLPLAIEISHHLSVDYISSDKELLRRLLELLSKHSGIVSRMYRSS